MTSDLLNSAQLAEYLQTSRDRAYRLMGGAILDGEPVTA